VSWVRSPSLGASKPWKECVSIVGYEASSLVDLLETGDCLGGTLLHQRSEWLLEERL